MITHEELKEKMLKKKSVRNLYNTPELEIDKLDVILKARKSNGLTQQKMAETMHTSQPAVVRIEKFLAGSSQHIPTTASLKKYAEALHGQLVIGVKTSNGHLLLREL
jgi:DNA-binding XRE family transcriptional regulator